MKVCKKDGKWYSLDNRRLWVFKRLEADGCIDDVEVMIVSSSQLTARKFTTNNGGTIVHFRHHVYVHVHHHVYYSDDDNDFDDFDEPYMSDGWDSDEYLWSI
jgi:hypothetical protein